jgi:hypothetical protein
MSLRRPKPPIKVGSAPEEEEVKKYCTAGYTTDDNTAHAYCMPDT